MAIERYVVIDRGDEVPTMLLLDRVIDVESQNLDLIAHALNLPSLQDFLGFPDHELNLLSQFMPNQSGSLGQIRGKWIALDDGIAWLDLIIQHIRSSPHAVRATDNTLQALQNWRSFLASHKGPTQGWRLEQESS